MKSKTAKAFKAAWLTALAFVLALCMLFVVACGGNGNDDAGDDPFGDEIVQKDYDYLVTIVSVKTRTVKLKKGDTFAGCKPTTDPKKSGAKFVGWFADGETTEFDWSKEVTGDVTIRARFETVEGMTVLSGAAYVNADDKIQTNANNTLVLTGEFDGGAFTGVVTPKIANDCGVVFGADATDGAAWENFDYFTALVNRDGNLLFAKIDSSAAIPWTLLGETSIPEFSPKKTYELKVAYGDGACAIYLDGALMLSRYIGAFKGNGVGYRAQSANTVFGAITYNPDEPKPELPNYTVTHGSATEKDGAFTTSGANTLIVTEDTFERGALTATVRPSSKNDCGVIFGANVTETASWENFDYYTVLINRDGILLFSEIASANAVPWRQLGETDALASAFNPAKEYELKIVYADGVCAVYVDGAFMLSRYIGAFKGDGVGYRAQGAGTVFGAAKLDAEALPPALPAHTVLRGAATENGGVLTATSANTLVLSDKRFESGRLAVEITPTRATDCGVIFGANATADAFWENFDYYTVVINRDGMVLFARVDGASAKPWSELATSDALKASYSPDKTYAIEIACADGVCEIYVNGSKLITREIGALKGDGVGYRTQGAGTVFGAVVCTDAQ